MVVHTGQDVIIVRPVGGLANQMGVYAAGRALAEKTGATLKLDISSLAQDPLRKFELDRLQTRIEIATPDEIREVSGESRFRFVNKLAKKIRKLSGISNTRTYKEKSLGFDPAFFSLQAPVHIAGNFPSLLYYLPVFPLLKKEFEIRLPLSEASNAWLDKITRTCSVAVHIRRGDYISNPKATAFHGVLGLDYYRRAFGIMREKFSAAEFFVFSDDPQWVRQHVHIPGTIHYVDCNDAENGYQDYWLMRHCKHHIVANSGFSRWAALLCDNPDQCVIRPTHWTTSAVLRDEDIGPSSWQLVDN